MGLKQQPNVGEVCTYIGKVKMGKQEAKRQAKTDSRRSKRLIEAFKCGACGRWHVGSRIKGVGMLKK